MVQLIHIASVYRQAKDMFYSVDIQLTFGMLIGEK